MRPLSIASLTTLVCVSSWQARGQAEFEWIEPPPDISIIQATDVSADGSVVVGIARDDQGAIALPFRWTRAGGVVLAELPTGIGWGSALGVSGDGRIIVGDVTRPGGLREAFRWIWPDDFQLLGTPAGARESLAFDVSPDGGTIVGAAGEPRGAYWWTDAQHWQPVPSQGTITMEFAFAVSGDGRFLGGTAIDTSDGNRAPCHWDENDGIQLLAPPGPNGYVRMLSSDASHSVGAIAGEAFRWSPVSGLLPLGCTYALALSDDGRSVVGTSEQGAYIWDAENGCREIDALLPAIYCTDIDGHTIEAEGISADGRTIAGYGNHAGAIRAWVLRLPPPFPGDLNSDGDVDLSDLAVLLAHFGTPAGADRLQGDLTGDGAVDLSDLAILLASFGAVCD